MSNLYKRTFHIDASYQVSDHLAKRFQRRVLEIDQSETRNACGGQVFKWNWNEMRTIYRGPSIDASYQVSVYLAMWFQRKRFLEIDQSETRIACGSHVC
jgi:hypothetical protein